MIREAIESTLPRQETLPDPVAAICTYLDQNGYPISGCFELSTIGGDDLKHWFKNSPASAEQFLPFGRGASGDVYALWLTADLDAHSAPVVMFGSEGDLRALAVSPADFCQLLCLGYREVGYLQEEDYDTVGSDYYEAERFRAFIKAQLGLDPPASGRAIVDAAAAAYPGFKSWVQERID